MPIQLGLQLGHDIKKRVQAQLGLCVSVGIARNCFLAKVASTQAKPDGLLALDAAADVHAALAATAVERLPGANTALLE